MTMMQQQQSNDAKLKLDIADGASTQAMTRAPPGAPLRTKSSRGLSSSLVSSLMLVGIAAVFHVCTIINTHKALLHPSAGGFDVPVSLDESIIDSKSSNPTRGRLGNRSLPEMNETHAAHSNSQTQTQAHAQHQQSPQAHGDGEHGNATSIDIATQMAHVTSHNESNQAHPTTTVRSYAPFEHHEGVVIVTKIQSVFAWDAIKQSFCLMHYAYNNRPLYDIIIFTSREIPEQDIEDLRQMLKPVKVAVVIDNPGLHEMVRAYTPEVQQLTLERCRVSTIEELRWNMSCHEPLNYQRISYNWQAEFRAKYLWTHAALAPYKTMMWMDSDAFSTRVWKHDPVAAMLQNDLRLLFLNFPAGRTIGQNIPDRVHETFGDHVCGIAVEDGHLMVITLNRPCPTPPFTQVHGFFHVTDLDFYRSPKVQQWVQTLISDNPLHREFDDQIAVTIPAAVLAPNRSWFMGDHGMDLDIFHNGHLDGRRNPGKHRYLLWWKRFGRSTFPEVDGKCPLTNET